MADNLNYFSDNEESEWLANIDSSILDKPSEEIQLHNSEISLKQQHNKEDEFRSASHTSVAHSPWINILEICLHAHKNLACWIINLSLHILLCSIAENFYSLFVFWLALGARQNTAQLVKIFSDTTQQNV